MLRLGRLVCGRLLFAAQIFVLAERLCSKINFRNIAHQPRQSLIATTSLRSALGFCRRSSPCFVHLMGCSTSDCHSAVAFFVRLKGLGQLVAPRQSCLRLCYCSVGVLLRNRRFCADSQKVNKFPFNYHPNPCNFVVRLRPNFTLLALLSASAAVRAWLMSVKKITFLSSLRGTK